MDDEQLEKALNFIRDKAKKFGEAKANRVYLMQFQKSKKSMLMRHAEIGGFKSAALQEREAYADDEYVQLLEGLKAAVEIEEMLLYQMKAAELKIEIWRTKQANQRAERQRYGA